MYHVCQTYGGGGVHWISLALKVNALFIPEGGEERLGWFGCCK